MFGHVRGKRVKVKSWIFSIFFLNLFLDLRIPEASGMPGFGEFQKVKGHRISLHVRVADAQVPFPLFCSL